MQSISDYISRVYAYAREHGSYATVEIRGEGLLDIKYDWYSSNFGDILVGYAAVADDTGNQLDYRVIVFRRTNIMYQSNPSSLDTCYRAVTHENMLRTYGGVPRKLEVTDLVTVLASDHISAFRDYVRASSFYKALVKVELAVPGEPTSDMIIHVRDGSVMAGGFSIPAILVKAYGISRRDSVNVPAVDGEMVIAAKEIIGGADVVSKYAMSTIDGAVRVLREIGFEVNYEH